MDEASFAQYPKRNELRQKTRRKPAVKLPLRVRFQQQASCQHDSRQQERRHHHEIGADFKSADAKIQSKSVEIEEQGIQHCHAYQAAHPYRMGADFREIIEEKGDEQGDGRPKHGDGQRLGNELVVLEIDEHPQVKNPGDDVRDDTVLPVVQLYGFDHVQRAHQHDGEHRHHESGQENQQHQLPLLDDAVRTKLVRIDQQKQDKHVGQNQQRVKKNGNEFCDRLKHRQK